MSAVEQEIPKRWLWFRYLKGSILVDYKWETTNYQPFSIRDLLIAPCLAFFFTHDDEFVMFRREDLFNIRVTETEPQGHSSLMELILVVRVETFA